MAVVRTAFRELLTGPIRFESFVERSYRAIRFQGRIGLEAIFGGNLVTNLASPAGLTELRTDVDVMRLNIAA